MKKLPLILAPFALCAANLSAQTQEDYQNFIIQYNEILTADGTVVRFPTFIFDVKSEGDSSSPNTISSRGATFELWTTNTLNNESWLLDTSVVGATRPLADIKITAKDFHVGVPRTRADQPYTVEIKYDGIQAPGEGVDEALTSVDSYHIAKNSETSDGEKTVSFETVTRNYTDAETYSRSQITPGAGQSADEVKGYETFQVELANKEDFDDPQSAIIASETIEVFPKTSGSFSNFGTTVTRVGRELVINALPRDMTFDIEHAYPGSEISLQLDITRESAVVNNRGVLSKNDETSDEEGLSSPTTAEKITLWHYNVPRNVTPVDTQNNDKLTFDSSFSFDASNTPVLGHSDVLTFSIISDSIFGKEVLGQIVVIADLQIKVNGNLVSSQE